MFEFLFFANYIDKNFNISFDISLSTNVAKKQSTTLTITSFKLKFDNENKFAKNIKQITNVPVIKENSAFLTLLKGLHKLNNSESPLKPVKITHKVEISV